MSKAPSRINRRANRPLRGYKGRADPFWIGPLAYHSLARLSAIVGLWSLAVFINIIGAFVRFPATDRLFAFLAHPLLTAEALFTRVLAMENFHIFFADRFRDVSALGLSPFCGPYLLPNLAFFLHDRFLAMEWNYLFFLLKGLARTPASLIGGYTLNHDVLPFQLHGLVYRFRAHDFAEPHTSRFHLSFADFKFLFR